MVALLQCGPRCIIEEDGARIDQAGRATVRCLFSIRSSVASGSSRATTPPNGETVAVCARASAKQLAASLTGTKLKNIEQLHFIFATRQFVIIVHSPNAIVHFADFLSEHSGVSGSNCLQ